MEKKREREPKLCPICCEYYTEHSALSRKDNKTEICPTCGTIEAIADFLLRNTKQVKRRIK